MQLKMTSPLVLVNDQKFLV